MSYDYGVPKEWVWKEHWEPHFAWIPVVVHGKRKWLTTVWRKQVVVYGDRKNEPPRYEYGNIFDVIKDEQ